jgi:hypothetical protein
MWSNRQIQISFLVLAISNAFVGRPGCYLSNCEFVPCFISLSFNACSCYPSLDVSLVASLRPHPFWELPSSQLLHSTRFITIPISILQQFIINVLANHKLNIIILRRHLNAHSEQKTGSSNPKRGSIDEVLSHLPQFKHSCGSNLD